jgi:amino acid transporter
MNATSNGLSANTLGVAAITFFVVSAAGPLVAIAGGVPVAMLLGNGAGIPATFAIALAILLTFAAGFTAMSRYVKSAGGFYAFAAHGLGGYAAATVQPPSRCSATRRSSWLSMGSLGRLRPR